MLDKILKKIKNKTNLSIQESREIFSLIITGKVNNENLEEFLINLSDKGETIDEITGGVMALREKCKNILYKGGLILVALEATEKIQLISHLQLQLYYQQMK